MVFLHRSCGERLFLSYFCKLVSAYSHSFTLSCLGDEQKKDKWISQECRGLWRATTSKTVISFACHIYGYLRQRQRWRDVSKGAEKCRDMSCRCIWRSSFAGTLLKSDFTPTLLQNLKAMKHDFSSTTLLFLGNPSPSPSAFKLMPQNSAQEFLMISNLSYFLA